MEHREVYGIPLKTFSDEIFKVSYIKVLTEDSLESVRLPTDIKNYKLQHLIQPSYLLNLELIKTKKNWVLKGINRFEKVCNLQTYKDYLKHTEMVNLVLKYFKEQQSFNLLSFFLHEFSTNFNKTDVLEFESRLLRKLGFSPNLEPDHTLSEKLFAAKLHNDLIKTSAN